ncbi:MAG: hypothetical protein WBB82_02140 [Limnothrix sp.]
MKTQPASIAPQWFSPVFWRWLGFNVLGFSVATVLCFSLRFSEQNIEMLFLSGLIIGVVTGLAQVKALKYKFPKIRYWQWLLANIVGGYAGIWLAIFATTSFGIFTVSFVIGFLLWGAIIGGCVGLAETVVLSRHSTGSLVWIPASLIGRAIAWLGGYFVLVSLFSQELSTLSSTILPVKFSLIAGISGSILYGVITGLALRQIHATSQPLTVATSGTITDSL